MGRFGTKNDLVQNILIFQKLAKYKGQEIYQVLKGENPQAIAIILARLGGKTAGEVLEFFSAEERQDIIYRMATGTAAPQEMLGVIVKSLEARLRVFDDRGGSVSGGSEKLAEILKNMDSKTGDAILAGLKNRDPCVAMRIQDRMIAFSDIAHALDQGLQKALAEIDPRLIALALKKTEKAVADKIISNLSRSRAALLREEFAALGPRRLSEVKAAQSEIVSILKKYEEKGHLKFQRKDDEWV